MWQSRHPARLSYQEWIVFIFDHSVPEEDSEEKAWYWNHDDHDYWDIWSLDTGTHRQHLTHSTKLLGDSDFLAAQFSLEQINQGLWMLTSGRHGIHLGDLLANSELPIEDRIECIFAMVNMFENGIFSSLADDANPSKILASKNPLMDSCYMWWDNLRDFSEDQDQAILDAKFEAMRKILALPNLAAQYSALHGLGHINHPDKREVIADYLSSNSTIHPKMKEYAEAAMEGKVL